MLTGCFPGRVGLEDYRFDIERIAERFGDDLIIQLYAQTQKATADLKS